MVSGASQGFFLPCAVPNTALNGAKSGAALHQSADPETTKPLKTSTFSGASRTTCMAER